MAQLLCTTLPLCASNQGERRGYLCTLSIGAVQWRARLETAPLSLLFTAFSRVLPCSDNVLLSSFPSLPSPLPLLLSSSLYSPPLFSSSFPTPPPFLLFTSAKKLTGGLVNKNVSPTMKITPQSTKLTPRDMTVNLEWHVFGLSPSQGTMSILSTPFASS